MKKVLTVATLHSSYANMNLMFEAAELNTCQDGESNFDFLSRLLKQANGKYVVFVLGDFSLADLHSLINLCSKSNDDILVFNGGYAYKTSVVKSVTLFKDIDFVAFDTLCMMTAKTLSKSAVTPFVLKPVKPTYSKVSADNLQFACAEFKKTKSKLTKEVYTLVFDKLKMELADFYAATILAIKDGKADSDDLLKFDEKIRQDLVLYLAFEKIFSDKYMSLSDLKKKNFKLSFFGANKLKKLFK